LSANKHARTLIIGYGNPGRQDDGLGPAFIQQLSHLETEQVHLRSNYQLTVEDAYDAQDYEQVIFVDACLNSGQISKLNSSQDKEIPFLFEQIENTNDTGLGSHSLSPNGVIRLCETLYNKSPKAFVLAILGYEFDQFEECLSAPANANLQAALRFFQTWLTSQTHA